MSKDLVEAVRNMIAPDTSGVALNPMVSRGAASPQTSAALLKGSGGGSAGGIGPFTETAYADRQFWASRMKTTPDGIFTLALSPIKKIKMLDANSGDASLFFADIPP